MVWCLGVESLRNRDFICLYYVMGQRLQGTLYSSSGKQEMIRGQYKKLHLIALIA